MRFAAGALVLAVVFAAAARGQVPAPGSPGSSPSSPTPPSSGGGALPPPPSPSTTPAPPATTPAPTNLVQFRCKMNISEAGEITTAGFRSAIARTVNLTDVSRVAVLSTVANRPDNRYNWTDVRDFEFTDSDPPGQAPTPVQLNVALQGVMREVFRTGIRPVTLVPLAILELTWNETGDVVTPAPGPTPLPRSQQTMTPSPYADEDAKSTIYAIIFSLIFGTCAIAGIAWVFKRVSMGGPEKQKKKEAATVPQQ